MRNPKWHRDEIILALDLYSRLEPGQINSSNPDIQELSSILNRLPIHEVRPDEAKFRNPNGVSLKLSNFLAIDPSYHGKGMQSFSQLDKKVFEEFESDTEELHNIASRIRAVSQDLKLANKLYLINEEDDREFEVREGSVIYKLHKFRERDSRIIQKKKEKEFIKFGRLPCEACTFDFYKKYGQLGYKYIECHHRTPLSEFSSSSKTTLNDLALVCSNCHRMLHRKLDQLSVEGLKGLLAG
ncbi:MAG: HNH endonuclease [Balneolaceae bacterium]|nr:MAG: HNH endonuclease [Balneolaceae bacterium]